MESPVFAGTACLGRSVDRNGAPATVSFSAPGLVVCCVGPVRSDAYIGTLSKAVFSKPIRLDDGQWTSVVDASR